MEDDLFLVRRQLVEKVIAEAPELIVDEAVEAFFTRRAEAEDRLRRFVRNLSVEGVTDLAQFTVALRQVRTLLG
jgi:NAD-specific glutamate dehydrogenase